MSFSMTIFAQDHHIELYFISTISTPTGLRDILLRPKNLRYTYVNLIHEKINQ